MQLKVALGQLPVAQDVDVNFDAVCRAMDFAIRRRAHILLTPEGSLSGYRTDFDAKAVRDALNALVAKAAKAGVGLALGTCFVEDDGRRYNQVRFYDQDGRLLGFHAKTVRCGTLTRPSAGEIVDYADAPLRTFLFNGTVVGGLICNDLWANPGCTPMPDPHLSQQLAQMGARVIFHAVNGGRDGSEMSNTCWAYHESNLRLRAHAGKLWIVTADNCLPMELRCSAPSGVIRPDGTFAVQTASKGEQCASFVIEL